jgi:predicted RNA binding protein YcfA (HicA-like mRNA interferase family)
LGSFRQFWGWNAAASPGQSGPLLRSMGKLRSAELRRSDPWGPGGRLLGGGPRSSGMLFARGNGRGTQVQHPRSDRRCTRSSAGAGAGTGFDYSDPGRSCLKTVTGLEMCRLVEANGWSLRRIKGSHHIYSKEGEGKIISIPVHGNKNLKPGLALRVARDAGVRI